MKSLSVTLLILALILSACTTKTSQESNSPPQRFVSQPAQPVPEPPPTPHPARSSWGGFPLSSAGSLMGSFSLHPARSLWGGFPLKPALIDKATTSSAAPSCESIGDFCIIQHHFPFQQPFSSIFNTSIESSYLYGNTQFGHLAPHHGVEILNPTGTPILAVGDGVVAVAGNDAHNKYGPWENFYGNLVILEHHVPGMEEPVYTLYGHLSTVKVQVGQTVKGGDLIGEVGATGRAIGSHLHFEVRVGSNTYADTRNPGLWLSPRNGENGQQYGTLVGKISSPQGNPIYLTLKVEYYPDTKKSPKETYYIETYASDTNPIGNNDIYQENFALIDLPPGYYRIALSASGKWTERWVEVESGKLLFVTIVSS